MKKAIMKKAIRLFSVLLCATVITVGATACSGGNDDDLNIDPGDRERQVTLKFLHIWPEHDNTMTEICNNFTKLHPNVKIQKSVKNFSNIDTTITSLWSAGQLPDVCYYWTHKMSTYVNNNEQYAMDITDYYEQNKDQFLADGDCFVSGRVNGRYYNVPFRATGFVIYYNKDLMDQIGVEVPKTLEEFETVLKTIKEETDLVPLACYGARDTWSYIGLGLRVYYDILSGRADDPNYRTERLTEDDAYQTDVAETLEKFRDWTNKGYFGSPGGGNTEGDEKSFINRQCVMAMLNNNSLEAIQEEMQGVEVGCISLPGFSTMENPEAGFVSGGYDGFFISNASRNKAWALEFLKYLNSPEVQQLFADKENSIMSLKAVTYKDPLTESVSKAMANVGVLGTYRDFVLSEGAIASSGNSYNYALNSSGDTNAAKAGIKAAYEDRKKSVEDLMLNPQGLEMLEPSYTKTEDKLQQYMEWIKRR